MLEDYAKSKGYMNTAHFMDDGFSSDSFERPGWKQMLSLIENDDIATVIVKDISRVGRDHLQVGFSTLPLLQHFRHSIIFTENSDKLLL